MAEIKTDVTWVPMVLNITNLELAKFIGTKMGEQLSRLQVIKKLVTHLKEKDLQDPENEESFIPDKTFAQEAIGLQNVWHTQCRGHIQVKRQS